MQPLFNAQVRVALGLFKATPLKYLQEESRMYKAEELLSYRQNLFTLKVLQKLASYSSNSLLPPTFRYREVSA